MHVFVTGGTGTIGSAVVAELLAHGHTILALARSDASERTLRDAGAEEETFGPFGPIFAADQPASSVHTREVLGWRPKHPSLLEDLENIRP